MDRHGADALRWFMLCQRFAVVGPPGRARGAGGDRPQGPADVLEHRLVPDPVRRGRGLGAGHAGGRGRPTGRCWTGGRCPSCTGPWPRWTRRWRTSTPPRAGKRLAAFVDDLSNWYVRRSRRRFWDGDPAALAHPARVPGGADPAAGAVHAVRHRGRTPGAGHLGLAGPARLGAPARLAPGRPGRRALRPGAGRAGRAGAPAGRAGPVGPDRLEGAHPAAAGPGAGRHRCRLRRLGGAAGRAAGAGRRRAERAVGGGAGVGRRRAGRREREAQLPGAGQAVRLGHQGGRGGGRGRRRRSLWPARSGTPARPR